ncbi:hypothetical protein PSP6_320029 [Paraburkholderia tropica]|nr:hypothetical protein PSP6_320029 [Paraburkholderia tropica]
MAIALTQSAKVARPAQSQFGLARREQENVPLTLETFPLAACLPRVNQGGKEGGRPAQCDSLRSQALA